MSDSDITLRLQYLEKVVNNLIPQRMAKTPGNNVKKSNTTEAGADAPVSAVAIDDKAIRMVLPSYRVPYQGSLVTVTAASLATQPEILGMMRAQYPECFVPDTDGADTAE